MDLKEAQVGTPLQTVNEIFAQGNFPTCPITDEIEEGKEVPIGELTDYEKAILLARNQITDNLKVMVEDIDGADELRASLEKLDSRKKLATLFDDFFWMSVRGRLNGKVAEDIGIRAGWKVVNIIQDEPGEKCEDCPDKETCMLLAMHIMME